MVQDTTQSLSIGIFKNDFEDEISPLLTDVKVKLTQATEKICSLEKSLQKAWQEVETQKQSIFVLENQRENRDSDLVRMTKEREKLLTELAMSQQA